MRDALMPRRDDTPYSRDELIERKVAWYVSRGYSKKDIVARVREAFPGTRQTTIDRHYDYWMGTKQAAASHQRLSGKTPVSRTFKSTKARQPKIARIGVSFQYYDAGQGEWKTGHMFFDVAAELTKDQATARIREQVKNWLLEFYQFEDSRGRFTGSRLGQINIITIEGV
jgi:hypothetical protein